MAVAVVPFKINAQGVAYVGGTRVTLDTVIMTFLDGATSEEIVQRYPSLDLADVYSTIGYYLHNKTEIDEYLLKSSEQSEKLRTSNESRFSPDGIRDRLLARKIQKP
jgi:uncharacterized protein (DUF433 family)